MLIRISLKPDFSALLLDSPEQGSCMHQQPDNDKYKECDAENRNHILYK